jgi:hypothetical protein
MVAADDGEDVTAMAEIGARGTDTTKSPDKAAEYYSIEDGPVAKLRLDAFKGWGSLGFDVDYWATDENRGKLEFDIKRMVRSHTRYNSFPHRLGHERMDYLESTSINGKVVRHTDLSPGQDYDLDYSLLEHRTEFQISSLRALTLAVEFRNQERSGHMQAFTTSHCDNCHTTSQAHRLDERTSDGTLEAAVDWRSGFIKGSVTSRSLTHGTPFVPFNFDNALHPEMQKPVFDNRLQFDNDINPSIADLWPEIDKDVAKLELHLNDLGGFMFSAHGVWSETVNKNTDLQSGYTPYPPGRGVVFNSLTSKYSGYVANLARLIGKKARFRWRGRVYNISNDDVFIDTIEREGVAGPHAGLTYQDVYNRNFDYWRYSALDRDVFESRFDLSYRLGKKSGKLRFLWDYETIDRENYMVALGETTTTSNVLGITYRLRPAKGWRVDAEVKHGAIDNPFMLLDGTCSTLESPRYTNPWQPETPQYHDFQDARIADVTASPSSWNHIKGGLTYISGKSTVSFNYRWWDGDNKDGDLTDWSRNNQTATLTFFSAPGQTWTWYVGAAWQDSQLDAPACIPIFDG